MSQGGKQGLFERLFPLRKFENVMQRLPEPDYSSSFAKYLPSLPLPAKPEAPSSLFAIVNKNAEHPPLIAQFTLTRAAPFKDQKFHRPPSQSIGSNYSPAAAKLQLNRLPPQPRLPEFTGISKGKRIKNNVNYYRETEADRPRSPLSQMNEMKTREEEFRRLTGTPSDRDVAVRTEAYPKIKHFFLESFYAVIANFISNFS